MNEISFSFRWIWMALPLTAIFLNLIWPRKIGVKMVALVTFVLAAWLHGFSSLNPLDRAVGLTERILTGGHEGTIEQVIGNLRFARTFAHQAVFEVLIAVTFALILTATPADLATRWRGWLKVRDRQGKE